MYIVSFVSVLSEADRSCYIRIGGTCIYSYVKAPPLVVYGCEVFLCIRLHAKSTELYGIRVVWWCGCKRKSAHGGGVVSFFSSYAPHSDIATTSVTPFLLLCATFSLSKERKCIGFSFFFYYVCFPADSLMYGVILYGGVAGHMLLAVVWEGEYVCVCESWQRKTRSPICEMLQLIVFSLSLLSCCRFVL